MTNSNQITASIGGITHLSGEVFQRLVKFSKDAKDAPERVRELATKTRNLAGILTNLELLASSLDDSNSSSSLKAQNLNACRQTLLEIDKKLAKAQDDFESGDKLQIISRRLKWPCTLADTKTLYSELSDHCDILQLALSANNMDALLKCLAKQEDLNKQFENKLSTDIRVQMNEKRGKVVDYFLHVNPQGNLEMSRQLRHAMTGMWLTESDSVFLNWKETSNAKLWLSGIPGGGKTVLCGAVIDTVLQESDEFTAVTYAFCDYKDPKTHRPENIVAALAVQLGQQKNEAFDLLEEYYEGLRPTGQLPREPKLYDLITLIQKMASMYKKVFIVVDGLDECGENVASITKNLKSLADRSETISTAFFSRNEVEIQEQLEDDYDHIEIEAHTEDLKAYVLFEVSQRRSLKKIKLSNPDLYEDIIQTLVEGARGMFCWVACQIDHISELPTNRARRKALRELPPTLFQTYDRVLDKVRKLPLATQAFIRKTLHWVALGYVEMEIPALCEAISIQDECDEIDQDDVIDEDELSRLCGCLLRKSFDGQCFEFPHFTVMEYLQSEDSQSAVGEFAYSSTEAWRLLIETSLRFLTFPCFNRKLTAAAGLEKAHQLERNKTHPFYPVAATVIGRLKDRKEDDEYVSIMNDETVLPHLRRLFDISKSGSFMSWTLHFFGELSTWLGVVLSPTLTPLHIAAHFHLSNVCALLLEKGADVNSISPIGTPLISALQRSWDRVYCGRAVTGTLQTLMEHGADTSARAQECELHWWQGRLNNNKTSALACALECWGDNPAILPMIRPSSNVAEDAITVISKDGDAIHEGILRAILEISTGTNAPPQWQPMASPVTLLFAQRNGTLPSEQPGNLLNDVDFWAALRLATEKGLVTELPALLADNRCHGDDKSGRDLLHIAAKYESNCSSQIITLLLDRLKLEVVVSGLQLSLYTSCRYNNGSATSVLLARGASISTKDGEGRTAWHIAAENGNMKVLRILSETDSNIAHSLSTTSGSGSTPLALALALTSGHADASLLLLGLCSADRIFFQPSDMLLHSAVKSGSAELFKALIAKGVSLESFGSDGSTPLHHIKPNITIEFARHLTSIYDISHLDNSLRSAFELLLSRWLATEDPDEIPKSNPDLWHLLVPPSHSFRSGRGNSHITQVWTTICNVIQKNFICCCENRKHQCRHYFIDAIDAFIHLGALTSYENAENKAGVIPVISALINRPEHWLICPAVAVTLLNKLIENSTLQPNLKDIDECYDLFVLSIRQNAEHLTTSLLEHKFDVHKHIPIDNKAHDQMSALEIACLESNLSTFDAVIAASDPGRLNYTLTSGKNLIDLAVEGKSWGRAAKIQSLHELGVELRMNTRLPPSIIFVAKKSLWDAVRCLVSLGADPFISDEDTWATIHYIVREGCLQSLKDVEESKLVPQKWHLTCDSYSVRNSELPDKDVSLLHLAACNGHDKIIEYLLGRELWKDVNVASSSGETPLHSAAWSGALSTVELLIRRGAKVGVRTCKNRLAVDYTLENGRLDIVKHLIKAGSPKSSQWNDGAIEGFNDDPDITNYSGDCDSRTEYLREISFEKAVLAGNVEACKRAIDQGRPISQKLQSCHNCTPLVAAIFMRRESLVEWLLDQGALPEIAYCHHSTYTDICQHAVDGLRSADCLTKVISSAVRNRTCRHPASPSLVHIAVARGRNNFLETILSHFKENLDQHMNIWKLQQASDSAEMSESALLSMLTDQPGQIDGVWETALHCASRNGNCDAVRLLINHGANVNILDGDRYTPLMHAVASNHIGITGELLANGAILELRNPSGLSAVAIAVQENHFEIIKLLEVHSPACLNFKSNFGQNLLRNLPHSACSLEVFQYLISRGLDPFFEDQLGVVGIWVAMDNSVSDHSFFDYIIHSNLVRKMPPGRRFNPLSLFVFHVGKLKIIYKCLSVEAARVFLDAQTHIQQSPLCRSASRDLIQSLGVLLEFGANIEQEGSVFGTPLMCAATYGQLDSLKFLVRRGANLQYINNEGVSRNAITASLPFPEITNWLLVGRYLDQKKIANSEFLPNQPVKFWSGLREMKVAIEIWQKRRWEESTLDYCKRVWEIRKGLIGKIVTGESL